MKTTLSIQMHEIMTLAWQFIKKNGFNIREALQTAWQNYKLRQKMLAGIVKFYYRKVDGSIREAYGSLKADLLPETMGTGRKSNDTVQTYFDTEKGEFRCFKKANLLTI